MFESTLYSRFNAGCSDDVFDVYEQVSVPVMTVMSSV